MQGFSVRELQTLPQIISGTTPEAEEKASKLFAKIAPKLVRMLPKEAEFAKLICNAYRYIQFAATNQFYTMVESRRGSLPPRPQGLEGRLPPHDGPACGRASPPGPCLFKDTLQLRRPTPTTPSASATRPCMSTKGCRRIWSVDMPRRGTGSPR